MTTTHFVGDTGVLLGRTLKAGKRAVIRCAADRVPALDAALWLCPEPDWLPHGTEAMGNADLQPIWITPDDTAPNGAHFLFLLDSLSSENLAAYKRVFDLFDGGDEAAVAAARQRWSAARACNSSRTTLWAWMFRWKR